jgi:hypothetical protein
MAATGCAPALRQGCARLLRIPGREGFGRAHGQLSRPDPLRSLGSGQIQSRLWRQPAAGLCATGS